MMKKETQKTAQRAAIHEFIKDNKTHPSAREIFEHVSEQLSTISMTTVYNTMELLKRKGFVQEIHAVVDGEGRRYDPNVMPHDHLICETCGKVIDIEVAVDHSLLVPEDQQHGFDINKISINVYGRCSECRNQNRNQSRNQQLN
jgi:Fe2+ or Zn2+ uptake regulation protein